MNKIRGRLKALRLEMLRLNLDAYYISGTDPHASEYLPERWQTRAFISGFTGSYGVVVVTQEEAGLWTDTRYFLQAEEQLKGTGIKMYKLRLPNAVSPENWLSKKLQAKSKVGIDPLTISISGFRSFKNTLSKMGVEITETPDLLNLTWTGRPDIPINKVFELNIKYAGLSRKDKKDLVISAVNKYNADFHVITMLDELAWMFNLRGSDIDFNPVFTGYGIVGKNELLLFTDINKMSVELKAKLEKEKIVLLHYNEFVPWLKGIKNKTFLVDPVSANYAVFEALKGKNEIVEGTSEISLLKARKNKIEIEGFNRAMKKDGIALVEFLFWLKNNLRTGNITEYIVGRKLAEFRAVQDDFQGESFPPIVGYKSHGAIVHLSVGAEDALSIEPEGLLLFDSGGQYLQGTTDITRTVALGNVSARQKNDYTLVLKGMIALTNAKFPAGTKGCHLDILARKSLWENGLNYGHGTGHGVGHFLNVHEGPASIRQEYNEREIETGMVFSNEPALYREGKYGIRTENMMVCMEKEETEFGKFLGFETLTLCPIDTELIDYQIFTQEEKYWLNNYHKRVNDKLKPLLRNELHAFLDELTTAV